MTSHIGFTSVPLTLLDFSAGFDTVEHNILLERLAHAVCIKWFESYVSDRL